jgi:hypothetical protein
MMMMMSFNDDDDDDADDDDDHAVTTKAARSYSYRPKQIRKIPLYRTPAAKLGTRLA